MGEKKQRRRNKREETRQKKWERKTREKICSREDRIVTNLLNTYIIYIKITYIIFNKS